MVYTAEWSLDDSGGSAGEDDSCHQWLTADSPIPLVTALSHSMYKLT